MSNLPKKLRADSKLHALTPEERAELDTLLYNGKLTLEAGVEWLAEHGVRLSMQSLSEYYKLHVLPRQHAHADEVAEILKTISAGNVTEGAHRAVAQRVFELATTPGGDMELLCDLYKLLLKAEGSKQADRKLQMLEAKAKAADEARELLAKRDKAKGISEETLAYIEKKLNLM